jgi:hypothetical protein
MPRGSAKFGGKSGVLPEVRQIFKQPIKPVVRPANPNVGYAEGVEHPEGISREQPLPTVRTVSGLIKDTVKDPKSIPDLITLNELQKEKVTKAALRRQYYVDSLKKEERRLSYTEQKKAQREAEEKRIKEESKYEMSESTKLTLPTISKLLEGPLMRERTEEEKQLLQAKREANRLDQELRGKENRADDLLDVYYAAENFIVTEEDLKAAIEDAFTTSSLSTVFTGTHANRSHNPALLDALFGTIKSKPGLVEVEEQITGERADFQQRVADAWAQEIKREEAESLDALKKN